MRRSAIEYNDFCYRYECDYTLDEDVKNVLKKGINYSSMYHAAKLIQEKENSFLIKLPLNLSVEQNALSPKNATYKLVNDLKIIKGFDCNNIHIKEVLECIKIAKSQDIMLKVQAPFSCLLSVVGSNNIFKWIGRYESEIERTLDIITDSLANYIIESINRGVKIISLADPSGMSSLLGEKKYKQFVATYIIRLLRCVEPYMKNALIHLCPVTSTSLENYEFISSKNIKVKNKKYSNALIELANDKSIKFVGHRCINAENPNNSNIYILKINDFSKVQISKMLDSDWPTVSKIYLEGIKSKKATIINKLPSFKNWNEKYGTELRYVARINNKVVGFIATQKLNNIYTLSIYVENKFKRQGIGSKLIDYLQLECQKKSIHTLQALIFEENTASIMLHKKMGFSLEKIIKLKDDRRNVCIYEWRI